LLRKFVICASRSWQTYQHVHLQSSSLDKEKNTLLIVFY